MRIDSPLYSLFHLKDQKKILKFDQAQFGYAYYKNHRVNLLNSESEPLGIETLNNELEKIKLHNDFSKPRVINLQYEYHQSELQSDDTLLGIDILFKEAKIFKLSKAKAIKLKRKKSISFTNYKQKFDQVYKNLIDGNSYQVNLTSTFVFKTNSDRSEDFIASLWNNKKAIGEYAHCIHSSVLDKLYLSNSPECLFQFSDKTKEIYSMPIKGTEKIKSDATSAWDKLKNSKKDQAELYMITDLMRNDLTKLELHPAKVVFSKKRLDVPGLIHSYSLIKTQTSKELSLKRTLDCLFPGGSITGAPKPKTMQLISQIEGAIRGLYCGSTIVLHKSFKAASINIRSAQINLKARELEYGSGGAITLLSDANDEYKECLSKVESFTKNFQA